MAILAKKKTKIYCSRLKFDKCLEAKIKIFKIIRRGTNKTKEFIFHKNKSAFFNAFSQIVKQIRFFQREIFIYRRLNLKMKIQK